MRNILTDNIKDEDLSEQFNLAVDFDDIDAMRAEVVSRVDLENDITDEILERVIDQVISKAVNKYTKVEKRMAIHKDLFDSIRGLDVIQELLEDDDIKEIMVNDKDHIFVEKDGSLQRVDAAFSSERRLGEVIQQIVGTANRRVNQSSPIVDTRLPDGSRVNIVLSPIAIEGSTITIRKFPKDAIMMDNLIEKGTLTKEVAEFLARLVKARYNIMISGGTSSGKTTFLNALSNFIPADERIITIEDSAELRLQNVDNLIRMEVRQENSEGENGVTIRELIKTSLRMRPDRIIVGEVRGGEALDMLQAMNTGHDGSMSTGHANSAKDILARIETMVLMGAELPLPAIRSQIASGIDIIVHLGRQFDGMRRVLEIVEIVDYKEGEFVINPLYKCEQFGGKYALVATGNTLVDTWKLQAAGESG